MGEEFYAARLKTTGHKRINPLFYAFGIVLVVVLASPVHASLNLMGRANRGEGIGIGDSPETCTNSTRVCASPGRWKSGKTLRQSSQSRVGGNIAESNTVFSFSGSGPSNL